MIVEEHIQAFINSLNEEENSLIQELEQEAHEHHVPIIRPETRQLLRFLLRLHRPERVLEIGTAIGYSATIMAAELAKGGRIDTIERNEGRYERAMYHLKRAGLLDVVTVHFGDALDILEQLKEPYDFIFMDAAKGQYQNFFDLCADQLKPGGLLLCDNILQEGSVSQSRYAVTRRDHTVHARMRAFLYEIKHKKEFDTVILPVGDGVALLRKRESKEDV